MKVSALKFEPRSDSNILILMVYGEERVQQAIGLEFTAIPQRTNVDFNSNKAQGPLFWNCILFQFWKFSHEFESNP